MPISKRPRKVRRPRLMNIPMTKPLHDEFALTLHMALANMSLMPSKDHFDAIAQIFNVVGLAIEDDVRFVVEARILNGGASAMNQISDAFARSACLRPTNLELLPVQQAANICDRILPRLNVTRLHLARLRLCTMTGQ